MVWILVFLPAQKLPSVYNSRMSFPPKICGDVRKLPRLRAWLFLSEMRHISLKFHDTLNTTLHHSMRSEVTATLSGQLQHEIKICVAISETLTNRAEGGVGGAASSASCVQHFVADVQVETRARLLGQSIHCLPVLGHIRPWRKERVKNNYINMIRSVIGFDCKMPEETKNRLASNLTRKASER